LEDIKLPKRRSVMKKIVSIVLISGLFAVMGCVGPFALTSKLNNAIFKDIGKGQTGGKGPQWAAEGVFLICAILPVYAITILGDALIFNSIEFWSGDNPIAKNPSFIGGKENQAVVKYNHDDNLLKVYLFENYRPLMNLSLMPDANGKMTAKTSNGQIFQAKDLGNGDYTLKKL
jgi:hypothetical protein